MFFKTLTHPELGFQLHRPLVGWAFAVILGTLLGFLTGKGWCWLLLATVTLGVAWWVQRYRALWLCLTCCLLTAWHAARSHDAHAETWQRLYQAQATHAPLALTGVVANDLTHGRYHVRFTLGDATFSDGTPVTGAVLRARYYPEDGELPKPGERWQVYALLSKAVYHHVLSFSAYGPLSLQRQNRPCEVPKTMGTVDGTELLDGPQECPLIVAFRAPEQIPRKRAKPYLRDTPVDLWTVDGRKLLHPKVTLSYYSETGDFPKAGEVWQLWTTIRKRSNQKTLHLSAKMQPLPKAPSSYRLPDASPWHVCFMQLRNRLAEHLRLGVSDEESLLTQTMTLGTGRRLPQKDRQRYADAGIIHIFSISGLHVGIVAGLFIWLFAWVGVHLRFRALFICPALVGYLLIAGAPPSATRACVMAIIYCFAPTFLRRTDASCALLLTAAAALLFEPSWITNVGALLSFVVMGGILLYMRPIAYLMNLLFHSRPRRTARGEFTLAYPWHLRWRQRMALLLGLTLAAWLGSLPLLLYFFGRLSIIGILLNLFVPAICAVVVWFACVSAVLGFIFPVGSALLNQLNAWLLACVDRCLDLFLGTPYAVIELDTPISGGMMVLLLVGLLFGGLYLRAFERYLRSKDPLDTTYKVTL